MSLHQRRVSDAAALKALAHPLRISLLELLVLEGPRTASEAGSALGQTPANCSWHLRKLAEHGFVEEAPRGAGRSRPWRAVAEGLSWGDGADEQAPETSAAGQALTDVFLERELERLRAARAAAPNEPEEWRDVASVSQSQTWLTADEARELSAAMVELFMSYTDRITDPDLRPDGARLVSLVGWLVPSRPSRSES
jgi:DNA-binding transcriptional ArsR family regulator